MGRPAWAFAISVFAASCAATDVTPVQKVIQLIGDMASKGKTEKHEEEVKFAEFHQWCDSLRGEKEKSIAAAALQIEELTADIAEAEAHAETLAEEIKDLEADIAKMEDEQKTANAIRNKEHEDYLAQHADFSESIDACERALQVLKTREADVPQTFLQLQKSAIIPAKAKELIESFLAMGSDDFTGAPEANSYEFQSGSVVSMIEKLRLKFQDQRTTLEKEELNAKANFEKLNQQLTVEISGAEDSAARKTGVKAERLEDAANAKADLDSTQTTKADDEKILHDTNTECDARSEEFEKNQRVRSGEVQALEKAMEILQSGKVAGNADTYLPASLVQVKHASFAQMRSETTDNNDARQRVVAFLQDRAKSLGSRYLSLVAARAAEDPFAKVKKMIKDLIVKLMEQANSEADQHAYCSTEMATNKQTREIKSTEVEELTATIDELTSQSSKLASEIAELTDDVAALTADQNEATKIRKDEKATNAKTVADAKEAQAAVEAATKVLRDFYSQAAEASMLQGRGAQSLRQEMTQATKEPYNGMQGESGGVFGMLEVILSDFARLESETTTSEDTAQTTYDKFMDESTQSIAVKNTAIKHKTNNKDRADERNRDSKKERDLTQGELDAALEYYEKLKGDCVETGLSYEERHRARDEEIQSLKEALRILNQQDLD